MNEMLAILGSWRLDVKAVPECCQRTGAAERERWPCGSWLGVGQGQMAEALA